MSYTIDYNGAGEATRITHHGTNESFTTVIDHYAEQKLTRIQPIDVPPPPPAEELEPIDLPLLAGMQIPVGPGHATVIPSIDMETYSEAGYVWNESLNKWKPLPGAKDKGLSTVGHRKYAQHETAQVLTFTYDLKDGTGKHRWRSGEPCPADLAEVIASGQPIEAHNAGFEVSLWSEVLVKRHGFPPIPLTQWRCSAAKARAWGLPASLANLGMVLGLDTQKDADGKRLMKMFSMPRDPTKADPRRRILPHESPEEFERYCQYCDTDVHVEDAASIRVPDLIPIELAYWQCDLAINHRGIGVDLEAVDNCIAIVEQVLEKYGRECEALTGGLRPSQVQALIGWLLAQGVRTKSLDAESLDTLLARDDLVPNVRRVIEIRALTGSASVKKVFAMRNHATEACRLHDLYIYHGARTGRDTHADVQPGNLPKAGPALRWCENDGCHKPYAQDAAMCPWCGTDAAFSRMTPHADPKSDAGKWHWLAVDPVLEIMASRSVDAVEYFYGDAMLAVSGSVRGLLRAAPGHRLICSDYSSIEAVVTAALAGEEWRMEAFRRKEDIYLHGAAGITGKTYEWYQEYAKEHGKHPDRQKIGKVAELALGFAGWIGAWRNFDKTDNYTDDDVRNLILKWRDASPAVVEMWGGQIRGTPWKPIKHEFYGLEGMAIAAVLSPGERFTFRYISYEVIDDVLYCLLPSGRRIAYHQPRLTLGARKDGWAETYSLTFMTWNSNPTYGPPGWVRMDTYAGRLTENAVQAVARDVMAHAVVNLEAAGYPIVLRVHDELAAEVPDGFGSVEEFERIMATLPEWAADWPIRAAGGYESIRYKKD